LDPLKDRIDDRQSGRLAFALLGVALVAMLDCARALANQPLPLGDAAVSAIPAWADPAVARLSNGNLVVVVDRSYAGDLVGRMFDPALQPVGAEFEISSDPEPSREPDVAATAGGFIVTWRNDASVYYRLFDNDGSPVTAEQLFVQGYADHQPNVAVAPDGESLIVWADPMIDGDGSGIAGALLGADGMVVSGPFVVNSYTTDDASVPDVAAAADGSFLVTWEADRAAGFEHEIFARRIDGNGVALGTDFQINEDGPGYKAKGRITPLAAGDGFVVVWQISHQTGDVFARRLDALGAPAAAQFLVASNARDGRAAVTAAGEIAITWGEICEIYGRRFSSGDQPLGAATQINAYGPRCQDNGELVSVSGSSDFIGVWAEGYFEEHGGVFATHVCVDEGADTDGDGFGDQCDPCTDVSASVIDVKPRLSFRSIALVGDPDNDRFGFSGTFVLPAGTSFGDIQPESLPIRLHVSGGDDRTILDVTTATGAFAGSGSRGWTVNGSQTRWTYRDKTGQPDDGIRTVVLTDRSQLAPGSVAVRVVGKATRYGIYEDEPIAQFSIAYADPATGACAETAFGGGDCSLRSNATAYACEQ
jgi:hypothetical protein